MAKKLDNSIPGLLIVDKPQGLTSHDVVSRVRRLAGTRKVGHAGTLDPMATGVLVLGIGKATRLLTFVTGDSKTYRATIRLGVETTTEDAEGAITRMRGCGPIDVSSIDEAMAGLSGDIMQVPSKVSALKIDGKRAHALVRAGEEVVLKARPVTVSRFEILGEPRPGVAVIGVDQTCGSDSGATENGALAEAAPDEKLADETAPVKETVPVLDLDVVVDCSSGTYVRALARDLGEALGVGAHLTALRRTRVGAFDLSVAHTLDDLFQAADETQAPTQTAVTSENQPVPRPAPHLMPLDDAVARIFATIGLDDAEAARFANGNPPVRAAQDMIQLVGALEDGKMLGVTAPDGRVMGLVQWCGDRLRTVLVF